MLLSLIPFGNSQNLNDHRAIRTIFSGSNFSSGISQAVAWRRFIKKKLIFENFAKFTGNICVGVSFQ